MVLSIKRVPTVVSNYLKEETEEVLRYPGGCGRNCLRSCCVTGAKLPLYCLKTLNKFPSDKSLVGSGNNGTTIDFLDTLLLGEWEERMLRGLFRYDVTACETKVIPGDYCFIAQLNEGRHLNEEGLLSFVSISESSEIQFLPNATINVEKSPSIVAINVSPIEYGHVLLIPRVLECLPQRIDRAFATINHLHFQAYYLAAPFPIEKAPSKKIMTMENGVKISDILNYPVRGLVFEGGNTLEYLSNVVSDACICLQENNVPFNVLIADSGKRIFLFPQCYAEKQALGEVNSELLDTQVNPAVWEISGHIVLKRKEDYEEASTENAWRLLAEVSLSEERLQEVKELIFESISCCVLEAKFDNEDPAVTPLSPEDEEVLKSTSHPAVVPV
ncbi:hypothetical protein F511_00384 [Dorcoceras hygrometricum]|nr:hypothetical protein F511_00384 [Dorcoceras hygrometricum]